MYEDSSKVQGAICGVLRGGGLAVFLTLALNSEFKWTFHLTLYVAGTTVTCHPLKMADVHENREY